MVTKQALEQATNASYQRELVSQLKTFSAGVHDEFDDVLSDFIKATSKDELFPWIRLNGFIVNMESVHNVVYWYVVKCVSTDAVQDMSDSTVLEALQKDGKLFARGSINLAQAGAGDIRKFPEVEFHNVKLKMGEELRLLAMTIFTESATGIAMYADLEYRLQGV